MKNQSESLHFNRLKNEKSLYLIQHKDQDVHWYPFGPEAIQRAKEENKPIFLSVGYSSCHWCHVMATESFEDPKTVELLNEHFICIKVDREEHPDIDQYYQKACQVFSKSGGWPLSAFLMSELKPFFVGTYFPHQKPSSPGAQKNSPPTFIELISELSRAFREDFNSIQKNSEEATRLIEKGFIPAGQVNFEGHFPPPDAIIKAIDQFKDAENGGYGGAPKFPNFAFYEWAVEQILEGMVEKSDGDFILGTLEKMLMGGIFDHARGGIHRYSTDEKWLVPHFEKMLYDQAGLIKVLAKATLIHPSPIFFDALIQTLDYLESEMLSEEGFFFSAQDSESEGQEGMYFTFSETEFEDALNQHDNSNEDLSKNMEKIKLWFQITPAGNFEHSLNVISLNPKYQEEYYKKENWDLIRLVRTAVLAERKNRIPPKTDTKGIASWNFMMVSALTDVIQFSNIDVIKKMATNLLNKCLQGVFQKFLRSENQGMQLLHATTMPSSKPLLEDFVFFAESQLRLYELTANATFKQNFKDTMLFITEQFLIEETAKSGAEQKLLTRAKLATALELYPNLPSSEFDQSHKSPLSTFVLLTRRAEALFLERDYTDRIQKLMEQTTHTALKVNPVNAGEALRALTYPREVYRVIKIPKSFQENPQFLKIMPYFLTRFVFDYTDEEYYEICSLQKCELKGNTIEEFYAQVIPENAT